MDSPDQSSDSAGDKTVGDLGLDPVIGDGGSQSKDDSNHDLDRDQSQPHVTPRELICLALLVALCDVTVYRRHGYAGVAALFLATPLLLWIGSPVRRATRASILVASALAVLAIRMAWCGSDLAKLFGFALLFAFSASLAGVTPFVLKTLVFATALIGEGHLGLKQYSRTASSWKLRLRKSDGIAASNSLNILLPVMAVGLFGSFFVLANPDVLSFVNQQFAAALTELQAWLLDFIPQPLEVLFIVGVLWIGVGALRPTTFHESQPDTDEESLPPIVQSGEAVLFPAYRNTLVSVIGLFAVYLGFEFLTLWGREFPPGFHYSGYAHEGAAWLTVALGAATVLLSLMFRGSILSDPRVTGLRRLSWVWSFENLLLAISVYHRLCIYIGFNGLTRMRMVGFLGISAVVVGLLLVLWMIASHRNFTWLLRRQLWTVAFAGYLYAVMPIDMWVNQYNVGQIAAGNFSPCVQISVHETSTEGLLELWPLVDHPDPKVRGGIRSILVRQLEVLNALKKRRPLEPSLLDWTRIQFADEHLFALEETISEWPESNPEVRTEQRKVFDEWAFQWY